MGDSSNFAAWKIRLKIITDRNDVLEYIQGNVPEPLDNAFAATNNKYNKGELKTKKIIADSLQDSLLAYIGNLMKSKDMYDKSTI